MKRSPKARRQEIVRKLEHLIRKIDAEEKSIKGTQALIAVLSQGKRKVA
jgi:hypothetical protein